MRSTAAACCSSGQEGAEVEGERFEGSMTGWDLTGPGLTCTDERVRRSPTIEKSQRRTPQEMTLRRVATRKPSVDNEARRSRADGPGSSESAGRSLSKNDPRSMQYVKVPFSLFDSGVVAVVLPRLMMTYFALRTFVWRSHAKGRREVRELLAAGDLVAPISQTKLGAIVGLRRQGVNEQLKELTSLEWIKVVSFGSGRSLGYQLGYLDPNGREVYFLDEWLRTLAKRMPNNSEKLLIRERVEIVRAVMKDKGVRPTEHVRSKRQGVSSSPNRVVSGASDSKNREGEEVEKQEYVERENKTPARWRVISPWNEARCRKALERVRDQPASQWPVHAIAGLFAELYQQRFKRSFPEEPRGWQDLRRGIERIAERDGLKWAKESIEAVFAEEERRWVEIPARAHRERGQLRELPVPACLRTSRTAQACEARGVGGVGVHQGSTSREEGEARIHLRAIRAPVSGGDLVAPGDVQAGRRARRPARAASLRVGRATRWSGSRTQLPLAGGT